MRPDNQNQGGRRRLADRRGRCTKHMNPIRVFAVDDLAMVRHGLAAMLATEADMVWLGGARSGAEALRLAPPLAPDLLLVDQMLPQLDGVQTIAALRLALPQARFVMLTHSLEAEQARRAVAAGAIGFLHKAATAHELVSVIRSAMGGQPPPARPVTGTVTETRRSGPGADLTQRERELIALMARGMSNQDISSHVGIAMPTVKFHVTNILNKLGADNRTEAVLVALKHKLATLD